MDWIQQWQSKLNKQNGVAPLVRTGGSRHTGLAALPYRNIHISRQINCQHRQIMLSFQCLAVFFRGVMYSTKEYTQEEIY